MTNDEMTIKAPLSGRVALVTGGSRNIGRAIALALARDGADVVINYRSRADDAGALADQIRAGGRRALAVAADVADPAQLQHMVETGRALGDPDIVVLNGAMRP